MGLCRAAIVGECGVEDGAKRLCRNYIVGTPRKARCTGIAVVTEQVEVVSIDCRAVEQLRRGATSRGVAGDQRAVEGEGGVVMHAAAIAGRVARDRGIGYG